MNTLQKVQLIRLIEKGVVDNNVGYYHSAGVIFRADNGSIVIDMWGFALIGKFGTARVALRKYQDVIQSLPESNPRCLRSLVGVGQLLELDWKELLEIHQQNSVSGSEEVREKALAVFKESVYMVNHTRWASEMFADAIREYRVKLSVPIS